MTESEITLTVTLKEADQILYAIRNYGGTILNNYEPKLEAALLEAGESPLSHDKYWELRHETNESYSKLVREGVEQAEALGLPRGSEISFDHMTCQHYVKLPPIWVGRELYQALFHSHDQAEVADAKKILQNKIDQFKESLPDG